MRCAMCGAPAASGGVVLHNGVFLCSRHASFPQCAWCGSPAIGSTSARPACVGCRRSIVDTDRTASEIAASLQPILDGFGIASVPMRLIFRADSDAWIDGFSSSRDPDTLGLTTYPEASTGLVSVEVALGLPRVEFIGTLAHELVHASMGGSKRTRNMELRLQEGLCEVLAEACVLELVDSYEARRFTARLRERSDPVYGIGYALVRDRVQELGLGAVIEMIRSGRW